MAPRGGINDPAVLRHSFEDLVDQRLVPDPFFNGLGFDALKDSGLYAHVDMLI